MIDYLCESAEVRGGILYTNTSGIMAKVSSTCSSSPGALIDTIDATNRAASREYVRVKVCVRE